MPLFIVIVQRLVHLFENSSGNEKLAAGRRFIHQQSVKWFNFGTGELYLQKTNTVKK